jgi:DNA-binding NarL/FixJ family response regulator
VAAEPIKLVIVDDHPIFRDGLQQALAARRGLRLLAAVGSGEEMWRALKVHGKPHIVLMDVEMPGESGIALTRALQERHPDVRVVC